MWGTILGLGLGFGLGLIGIAAYEIKKSYSSSGEKYHGNSVLDYESINPSPFKIVLI